jgi:hypothetical protein
MKKITTKQRLQELAAINNPFKQEVNEFIDSGTKAVAQKAFGRTTLDTTQAIEDGYYALTDNLPNLINDLEKAAKEIQSEPDSADEVTLIRREAEIYRKVQELIDQSVLGSVL